MIALLLASALVGAIGAMAANTINKWLGSPDMETMEYSTGMIFSPMGAFLLKMYARGGWRAKIGKLFMCQYCLSVWMVWVVIFIVAFSGREVPPDCLILGPLCTGPIVKFINLKAKPQ